MEPIRNAGRCRSKPVSVPEVFDKPLLALRAKLDLLGIMLGQAVDVGPGTRGIGPSRMGINHVHDASGRTVGTATKSDGQTTFRDASGRTQGSSSEFSGLTT